MTEQIKEILNKAIPIGSRVWGGHTKKSDTDLVLSEEDSETLEGLLVKNLNETIQIVPTQYDDDRNLQSLYNYKVTYKGQLINIIVIPKERIKTIENASLLMVKISAMGKEPKDRDERIRRFGHCIQIFAGPEKEISWKL